MDTKWKNTADEFDKILYEHWRKIVCVVIMAVGAFLLLAVLVYGYYYYDSVTVLMISFLGNLLFAGGMVALMYNYFSKNIGAWEKEETAYDDWKIWWRRKSRWIRGTGVTVLVFFGLLFIPTGPYLGIVFSAALQFIICEMLFRYYRQKDLDAYIKYTEEQNQRKIEEALENERRSMEKVSRSDQLRIDLITNVSHDLKTPLTSMVGYIELMKKEELSDVMKDYVEIISQRAEKLKEMINSLFSLAKASSGNVELKPEKFEVNRLIQQIFADMDDQIKDSGLEFVTRYAGESTEIISDNMYFYRIIQNLVENALKYSAKGTRVFVKTSVSEEDDNRNRVHIEITNTAGYLMDFEAEDILERFARGDKARSTDGNGLGLAIVSTYTKALGGEFEIRTDCDQFKACLEIGSLKESGSPEPSAGRE